jgi:hypothetical protein
MFAIAAEMRQATNRELRQERAEQSPHVASAFGIAYRWRHDSQANLPCLTCLCQMQSASDRAKAVGSQSRPTAERWSCLRHLASGNASRTR